MFYSVSLIVILFIPYTGTYQPSRGQASCRDCPAGYFCTSKVENLEKCPPKHYCPTRTEIPVICPNGTFTNDTAFGLERADDCRPCPSGSYCKSGRFDFIIISFFPCNDCCLTDLKRTFFFFEKIEMINL